MKIKIVFIKKNKAKINIISENKFQYPLIITFIFKFVAKEKISDFWENEIFTG